MKQQRLNHLFLVIDLLIALSLLIFMTRADLGIAHLVVGPDNQWPGLTREPWTFLYILAPVPAFMLAGSSLSVLLGSLFHCSWKKKRRRSFFILLLLALGPGLLVNVVLKDHLGRARPQELVEFGGNHQYSGFWQPGPDRKNSSFPSGHAAVAFFLMAPWFIYRKQKKRRAFFFLGAGITFGLLVGTARILQGAHFISDILWAGGLVYLSGELLSWLLHPEEIDKAAGAV